MWGCTSQQVDDIGEQFSSPEKAEAYAHGHMIYLYIMPPKK